ncbi:hypothetical protein BASA83_011665 [Batrachochytrium salamandrivorans]|nr:hypothetical protein BASA83_011665 [Batrachochytrium salamandrivorans]
MPLNEQVGQSNNSPVEQTDTSTRFLGIKRAMHYDAITDTNDMDVMHHSSSTCAEGRPEAVEYNDSTSDSSTVTQSCAILPKSILSQNIEYAPIIHTRDLTVDSVDSLSKDHYSFIDGLWDPLASQSPTAKVIVSKPAKLLHYDGLRGLAAIWVFFIHYFPGNVQPLLDVLLGFQSWSASVPLFFILSGRVLTVSILRSGNNKQLASAIIRRPFRLLIPMIILAFIDMFILHVNTPMSFYQAIVDPLWFMFDDGGIPKTLTGVVWTLSNEYKFSNVIYFTTFVLIQFQNNNHARYIIMGTMFVWFHLTHSWGTHFISGLLLADLAQHGFIERYKSWRYSSYITAAVFFTTMIATFRFSFFNIADTLDETIRSYQFSRGNMGVDGPFYSENALIFTFCFASMFAIETSAWLQRFFSWSLFTFLGRISFPLYLIHSYTFPYFDVFNKHVRENISHVTVAGIIIAVIPTILVCMVSYLLVFIIDEPSVTFGRWVEKTVLNDEWSWSAVQLWVVDLPRRVKLDISQRIFSLRGDIMRLYYGRTRQSE